MSRKNKIRIQNEKALDKFITDRIKERLRNDYNERLEHELMNGSGGIEIKAFGNLF